MTSPSNQILPLEPRELAEFGAARAKDVAYDAVMTLWRRRQSQGMKQRDLADAISCSPGWISKRFRGPNNWTIGALGALVEGLRGELEIVVYPAEDAPSRGANRSAYDGYTSPPSIDFQMERDSQTRARLTGAAGEFKPTTK